MKICYIYNWWMSLKICITYIKLCIHYFAQSWLKPINNIIQFIIQNKGKKLQQNTSNNTHETGSTHGKCNNIIQLIVYTLHVL